MLSLDDKIGVSVQFNIIDNFKYKRWRNKNEDF